MGRLWQMATGWLRPATKAGGGFDPAATASVEASLELKVARVDGTSAKYRLLPDGRMEFVGFLFPDEWQAIRDAAARQQAELRGKK